VGDNKKGAWSSGGWPSKTGRGNYVENRTFSIPNAGFLAKTSFQEPRNFSEEKGLPEKVQMKQLTPRPPLNRPDICLRKISLLAGT